MTVKQSNRTLAAQWPSVKSSIKRKLFDLGKNQLSHSIRKTDLCLS